jgi:hypothetical protein
VKATEISVLTYLAGQLGHMDTDLIRKIRDINLTIEASRDDEPMTVQEINAVATLCGTLRRIGDEVTEHIERTEAMIGRALADRNEEGRS